MVVSCCKEHRNYFLKGEKENEYAHIKDDISKNRYAKTYDNSRNDAYGRHGNSIIFLWSIQYSNCLNIHQILT